jgi:hypothetical protein
MPEGINAVMEPVEPTDRDSVRHRRARQAGLDQLRSRYNSVLLGGDSCDREVWTRCRGGFRRHACNKSPRWVGAPALGMRG